MEQTQSKNEQLIHRKSYSRNKERLSDIKLNHLLSKYHKNPNSKVHDSRRNRSEKLKQIQISKENQFLINKITKINTRSYHLTQLYSTEKMKSNAQNQKLKRYDDNNDQIDKLQVKSDYGDGEEIKFILPHYRQRAFSFLPNENKYKNALNKLSIGTKAKDYDRSEQNTTQIGKQFQKQIKGNKSQKDEEDKIYFLAPQKNETRQVIYKKTTFISSMCSCLFEISLINNRMLIMAYVMGVENFNAKLLLRQNKTKQIMNQYSNNYEMLCNRLIIQKRQNNCRILKIANLEKNNDSLNNTQKDKKLIQHEFLKRNYYTLMKNQQANLKNNSRQKNINKKQLTFHNANTQKVTVFQRLAVPKLAVYKGVNNDQVQNDQTSTSKNTKENLELKLKQLKMQKQKDKQKVINNFKIQNKNQVNQQQNIVSQNKTTENLTKSITNKINPLDSIKDHNGSKIPSQNFDQQINQYQASFQNPSEVNDKENSHGSKSMKKINFSLKKQQKLEQNYINQSLVESNAQYQEDYESEFKENESINISKSDSKFSRKLKNVSKISASKQMEEVYEQQFQN